MSELSKLVDMIGRALVIAATDTDENADEKPEIVRELRTLVDSVGHSLMQQAKRMDSGEIQ